MYASCPAAVEQPPARAPLLWAACLALAAGVALGALLSSASASASRPAALYTTARPVVAHAGRGVAPLPRAAAAPALSAALPRAHAPAPGHGSAPAAPTPAAPVAARVGPVMGLGGVLAAAVLVLGALLRRWQRPTPQDPWAMCATGGDTGRQPNLPIKIAAQGMGLLKPIFQAEALVQAAALGALTGVDKAAVAEEIEQNKRANKVLIYTYGLSPFSAEAIAMLEGSGYEYTQIELGLEWFLLGGKGSETRVALSKELEGGATSLPKIFIGGKCIGGCAELAALVEGGELDAMMRSAGARRRR